MPHSWVSATLETTLTMTKNSQKVVGNWSRLSFQLTDSLLVNFRAVALLPWRRRRNLPVRTLPSKAFQLHILCWRAESLRMGTYKQQGILLFSACYQLSKDLDQSAKKQQQNWDGCWAVEHQQKLQIETHNIRRVSMTSTFSWRQFEIQEAQVGFWLE